MNNNRNMITIENKSTLFKHFVLGCLLCGFSTGLSAQSQYDVIVRSDFSPVLADAQQKINEKANIVDTVKITKPVEYNILSPVFVTGFTPEPINPPKVGKDQITRLYRNFVKFGFGNYWTPYLDFELNSLRSTKGAYGVRAFHHSSWGKIKTYAPASFSDSKVEGYAQKFFKGFTLNANAGYEHFMAHCYGFQPDSVFPQEMDYKIKGKDISRQYHHLFAEANFSNNGISKDKLNQDYTIRYDFLTDNNPKTYEHQLDLLAALNHNINLKRFSSFNVGGEIGLNYFHNRWQGSQLSDNTLLNINPHATFKYKEYYFKAGFDFVMHFGKETKMRFYPDIDFRLHIVPEVFTFYAGLNGGYQRNSYLSLMQENPFLSDELLLGFQDKKFNLFAGVQLGLSRSLSIGARGSYAIYDGMPFFINDIAQAFFAQSDTFFLKNTFTLVEDKANVLNLHFDLKYQFKNMLWLTFNVDYYNYNVNKATQILRPWYKPQFVAGFDIEYILLEKFLFGVDAYISMGAKYPKYIANGIAEGKLKSVFDFNFKFEYLWSKRFSIFANVNNFAFQRNYFYHDYPSQRINCLVGVKYNFGGESLGKK